MLEKGCSQGVQGQDKENGFNLLKWRLRSTASDPRGLAGVGIACLIKPSGTEIELESSGL